MSCGHKFDDSFALFMLCEVGGGKERVGQSRAWDFLEGI